MHQTPSGPRARRTARERTRALAGGVALAAAVGLVASTPTVVASGTPSATADVEHLTGTLVRAYDETALVADSHAAEHGAGDHDHDHDHDAASSEVLTWVESRGEATRVPTDDVIALPTGATVKVRVGDEVDDAALADGLEPAREVLAASVVAAPPVSEGLRTPTPTVSGPPGIAAAAPTAVHDVAVVMAVPSGGARDGTTLQSVVDAVNGPASAFWSSQTGGGISFAVGATRDWATFSASCSEPMELWAQAARAVGFTPGPDKHLLLYIGDPAKATTCAAGLATVGSGPSAGGRSYVTSTSTSLIAHELGHNLGLYHSGGLQCAGAVEAASGCAASEYRDLYDVMGGSWSQVGSLSAPQAHRLGALSATDTIEVTGAGGTYSLAPMSARGSARVVRLTDGGSTYWVEHRAAVGQDSWLGTGENVLGLQSGVIVRRSVETPSGPVNLLLDASPAVSPATFGGDWQTAVAPGGALLLASGRWRVVVGANSSTGVTVTVSPTDGSTTAVPVTDPAPPVPVAPPSLTSSVSRRQGEDRYATAVAISQSSHPGTSATVVVASGETFPDALAAGPAAAMAKGPLLLVPRGGAVPAAVMAELTRLRPGAIILAGGRAAVTDEVADQLAAVAPVSRAAGEDRFETAAQLSTAAGQRGGTVYLASGATHADAVSGAALAAGTGATVLLTQAGSLPEPTSRALAALAPTRVVVLGGQNAVQPAVEDAVRALSPGATVERLAGDDRYDTAARITAKGYPDGASTVYLALGDAFADALAGGPAAGRSRAPLLLTKGTCVPPVTLDRLAALGADQVVILGGATAITQAVAEFRSC